MSVQRPEYCRVPVTGPYGTIMLTATEYRIYNVLCDTSGGRLSASDTADDVWGMPSMGPAVRTNVCRMRRKLGPVGINIRYEPRTEGRGYWIDVEES